MSEALSSCPQTWMAAPDATAGCRRRKTLHSTSVARHPGSSLTLALQRLLQKLFVFSISCEITECIIHLGESQPGTHAIQTSPKFSEVKDIKWFFHSHYLASLFLLVAFPSLTSITSYCSLGLPWPFFSPSPHSLLCITFLCFWLFFKMIKLIFFW